MGLIQIDIHDNQFDKIDGPIAHVISFTHTWRLDLAGSFSFAIPAAHFRASLIQAGRYAVAYEWIDGGLSRIGGGVIEDVRLTARGTSPPVLTVSGRDMLSELARISTETLTINNATSGPASIMAKATTPALPVAWTSTGSTAENVSHQFDYENLLEALIILSRQTGEHFRLNSDAASWRELTWIGAESSFTNTGILATNSVSVIHAGRNDKICLVVDIEEREESNIINRVYPFGGDGTTLSNATLWPDGVTIAGNNPKNFDGDSHTVDTTNNYLENDDSQADFGSRFDARLDLPDVRELGTSTPEQQQASNLLLSESLAWMRSRSRAKKFYNLTVTALDTDIKPGETMYARVVQFAKGEQIIDIDATLNVIDISPSWDAAGRKTCRLGVSTTDRPPITNATIARNQTRQLAQLLKG